MYVTALLDFSRDPLSDTTPAWTDITPYLLEARWSVGVQKEGDEPQPGQATFVLDNRTRRFEPDYAAGAYYPDIVDMRRFRWRVQNGVGSGTVYSEGVFYAADWAQDWGASDMFQKAVVAAGDGSSVLSLDDLPQMDPPDANSYTDVVLFDEPFAFYMLGEQGGAIAKPRVLFDRRAWRNKGSKNRRKFMRRQGTRYTIEEAASGAGPAGTYRDPSRLMRFGVDGLVVGSPETCVEFHGTSWMQAKLEDGERPFSASDAFTLEFWSDNGGSGTYIAGPHSTSLGNSVCYISNGGLSAEIGGLTRSIGSGFTAANLNHVVGTWDGTTLSFYVNGALQASGTFGGGLDQEDAGGFIYVNAGGGGAAGSLVQMQAAAFYLHALSAERVLAHYEAGSARGWPQHTAGTRIADIATHALWSEASIQTTGRDVQPMFQHGQARVDEIAELAHAEGPQTAFFFNGTGDPVYRGHEWQSTAAAYNTVQATFGNQAGEVPYEDIELVNDNETFNDITVSHESGDLVQVTDSTSIGQRGRRANSEWTDVLLAEHNHVESLADHLLAFYKDPQFRPARLVLNGDDPNARTQIFERQIGHLIRIKHRPAGGTAIDRVCHILGYEKSLEAETGQLRCAWNLSRGFNASLDGGQWHAGIVGFSEAGTTTNTG